MSALPIGAVTGVTTVLLGACFGAGLVAIVGGTRPRPDMGDAPREHCGLRELVGRLPVSWRSGRRLALAGLAGAVTAALTAWPVAGVLTTLGALTLPGLLGPDTQTACRTEQMEALATWTEMLRDTLSAAAGLEQAVLATADIPPAALEKELHTLASSLREGRPLHEALEEFAQQIEDPLADVVVTALAVAARKQASQLAALLGELAESVREQVAMRQRIAAGRASVRTGVRVTVTVTLGMALGLVVLNRPYLDPFDTITGQGVLALAGALFALSFTWLNGISRIEEPARLITLTPTGTTAGGA